MCGFDLANGLVSGLRYPDRISLRFLVAIS